MSENLPGSNVPREVDWLLSVATTAWSVGRQLRRDIALQLAPEGITAEDFLTLRLLRKTQSYISQVELAEWLGISTAQTSGLVERLKQRGWITPERDPQDRRRQCWVVTVQGHQEDDRLMSQLQPLALISTQSLPAEDCEQLVSLLTELQGKNSLPEYSSQAASSVAHSEPQQRAA